MFRVPVKRVRRWRMNRALPSVLRPIGLGDREALGYRSEDLTRFRKGRRGLRVFIIRGKIRPNGAMCGAVGSSQGMQARSSSRTGRNAAAWTAEPRF